MNRKDLLNIKRLDKRLLRADLKPLRRGTLPKPFDKIGGARITSTGLLDVAENMSLLALARDGDILERRAFYLWLLRNDPGGLLPLAALHYHPSHKGVHMLTNCETGIDHLNRQLPGAPEFALRAPNGLDPANEADRSKLLALFCHRCGIHLGEVGLLP